MEKLARIGVMRFEELVVGWDKGRRAPEDELERMHALYQQDYQGFTIEHFHEKLEQRHDDQLGDTTTRLYLQKTGTVQAPRRGAHRRKRPRRPMRGMLLHQDGSKHPWLANQPALDLVITMDDATSEIDSAFLVDDEGTSSSFRGLAEVIERHGLFMELDTHRGSHDFFTPEAGGKVSKTQLTQVGRALKQLGQSLPSGRRSRARAATSRPTRPRPEAAANAPLAPSRTACPRSWLWLASPPPMPPTGSFARYLPEHNGRFAEPAEEPASAFVVVPEALWRDVLAIQEERCVGNDNCVTWRGRQLQIPPTALRPHLVRARVRVHDHPDGTVAIFKGPRRLASFPPDRLATAQPTDQELAA